MLQPTCTVGFCITFGSLFAKIRCVYELFNAAERMQRIQVSTMVTLKIVGIILIIDVMILTIWTVIDPLQWTRDVVTADKYGNALSSVGYCSSEQSPGKYTNKKDFSFLCTKVFTNFLHLVFQHLLE